MKPVGGYFELELPHGEEYHKSAIRLNTGRNAFEYVLRAKRYKKVYLPYYTCDVMLEPIHKLNLDYEFYSIDLTFRPVFDFSVINSESVFVYTNYFGLCDENVESVSSQCKNLIVDNSQAFYSNPLNEVDTFYVPRKFFGVPDGAYLYTNKEIDFEIENDISYKRFGHLLGRIDIDPENFYSVFKQNDESLNNQTIKKMSKLTHRILSSIDYEQTAERKKSNFNYLHHSLLITNRLKLNFAESFVPMVYPYLNDCGEELKKKLIQYKIFTATYWPNVLEWTKKEDADFKLTKNLIAIPIDQRYDETDMSIILQILKK